MDHGSLRPSVSAIDFGRFARSRKAGVHGSFPRTRRHLAEGSDPETKALQPKQHGGGAKALSLRRCSRAIE